ncbi:hypothetical protein G9A89_014584 [Geosiphon pyriformis]|nr:hypothetical protein G9A89_014584 [Geosiphon pyriformis]
MGNYSYLSQQSKEHFAAHNKNDLNFIELNPLPFCLICFPIEEQSSRQFQDFWNWFLNEHSAETYTTYTTYYFDQAYFEDNFEKRNNSINQLLYSTTFEQQPPDFEYLNHQIHIWIAAHQSTVTSLETEEESYQTASIFDLFLSESKHSTQTVTPELMAQDPMQIQLNDWTTLKEQSLQTSIMMNTSSKLLMATSKTPLLPGFHKKPMLVLNKEFPGKIVTEYAKAIRKLIKCVDSGRNWTKEQKIHFFTKELRTDLSYAFWPLLALKNNLTIDMAIELAQRIEDNQRMHLESTLPVFAPASVMASISQMTTTSFAAQTQDPNEQLIDRLTANLVQLLESLA